MTNFKISTKAFIVKENQLLIIKRDSNDVQKPNIWEIPGGRLHLGEDPVEGLKRETKEEVGINIEVLHPISIRHFTRDDVQTITMIIFPCIPLESDISLSKEHTDFEWIKIENSKDKLTSFFHKEIDVFNKVELGKLV